VENKKLSSNFLKGKEYRYLNSLRQSIFLFFNLYTSLSLATNDKIDPVIAKVATSQSIIYDYQSEYFRCLSVAP